MAESKEKPEPLRTREHLSWLTKERKLDQSLLPIIQEFLIGTPALETSFKSNGFVQRFGLKDVSDALTLFEYLTRDVEVEWDKGSAGSLAEKMRRRGWDDDDFWDKGELMALLISSATKADVKKMLDGLPTKTALVEEKREVTTKYFNLDDALFKHIRNSLAHGLFSTYVNSAGTKVFAFQDSNKNGDISARIVLSEQRLRDWITQFHRFEKLGV